jgi:DNA (cytosine-5)-methyltransferase 1
MVNQQSLNELALFAGAGGGILGGHLLGWRTVCAVEWEQYPASVLCARQNDGLLPPFPIWDDVQTFKGEPWRGIVDVISGGFPCTDISAAGKGAGIDGEASGMWREMARIIHEVRPRYVFVENSPMLTSRGLGRVLGDLAAMGFDARWGVLGAADVGAPHQRDRIWIVAKWRGQLPHAQHDRIRWWEQQQEGVEKKNGKISNTTIKRCEKFSSSSQNKKPTSYVGWHDSHRKSTTDWWTFEPDICRVADGVAFRNDRLKAIGNGQVPLCAATAWRILK